MPIVCAHFWSSVLYCHYTHCHYNSYWFNEAKNIYLCSFTIWIMKVNRLSKSIIVIQMNIITSKWSYNTQIARQNLQVQQYMLHWLNWYFGILHISISHDTVTKKSIYFYLFRSSFHESKQNRAWGQIRNWWYWVWRTEIQNAN